MTLYNVSFNIENKARIFYPIIPDTYGKGENNTIKRVCLSDSVENCIQAMSSANRNLRVGAKFILRSVESSAIKNIIKPEELVSRNYVIDAIENHEYWSLDPVCFSLTEYEILDFETEFDAAWNILSNQGVIKRFKQVAPEISIPRELFNKDISSQELYNKLLDVTKYRADESRYYEICDDLWEAIIELPYMQVTRVKNIKLKQIGIEGERKMLELNGKYNTAKVFTNNIDSGTIGQLTALLNQKSIEGSKIRIMSDCHQGAGCVIGTTMTITDKVIPNLVGVDVGCMDMESEVLTPEGWIKISEYGNQQILVYDVHSDLAFFEQPEAYIKLKCDKFYKFNHSKGLNQVLSEEHKMLIFTGNKGRGYTDNIYNAEEFYNKLMGLKKGDNYSVKATFDWDADGLDMTDDILRLLIMESADGHLETRKNGDCYNVLHFSKERKIERAKELLEKCGIEYTESTHNDKTVYITFKDNRINTKDLRFLYRASKHQLEVVADEVFFWDGNVDTRRDHKFFSTTVKENADVIQWVFAALGIRAGIYTNHSKNENWSDTYVVYTTKNAYVSFSENKPSVVESVDGYKYCFTTPTGFFVMRRGNSISITGNCGMYTTKLKETRLDLPKLDSLIKKHIPSGFSIRNKPHKLAETADLYRLHCYAFIDNDRAEKSIGTLGGGNHFIEVDKDDDGNLYLVVHTGSRNLGKQIAEYYQAEAWKELSNGNVSKLTNELIRNLKKAGRESEIETEVNKLRAESRSNGKTGVPRELAYCEGKLFDMYIHDMKIAQQYAVLNREAIVQTILKEAHLHAEEQFQTIHNYIDMKCMILRKGSISAQQGEQVLIPINMRDGSLICVGKGNPDWNYSAPHGAGRVLSRSQAKQQITLSEFKKTMKEAGVYTTSVNTGTIDESPMAYKPMEEIMENIADTVDIIKVIKPIYNFKASGD